MKEVLGGAVILAVVLAAASFAGCSGSSGSSIGVDPGTVPDAIDGVEADQLTMRDDSDGSQELQTVDTVLDSALDVSNDADSCTRVCGGRDCGDDGCGGNCGTCTDGMVCTAGICTCAPQDHKACCDNAVCWFDSCGAQGEKVADCPYGCTDSVCNACVPRCEDKECGEDGCGEDCGTCAAGKCEGLNWTPAEFCDSGTCVTGQAENCDDANPCTVDTCDAKGGCSHTVAGDGFVCVAGSCDGQVWTLPMTCISGQCIGGGGTEVCKDANDCTDDTCSPALGCSFSANGNSCDDEDPCTTGDVCHGGSCLGNGDMDCDDKNSCTADSCMKSQGCIHTSANEGRACGTSDCTGLNWVVTHECSAGTCQPSVTVSCDDALACTTDGCAPSSGCSNVLQAQKCLISGECFNDGQLRPGYPCQICSATTNRYGWSNQTDLTECAPAACSDLILSYPKSCRSGQCIGSTRSCDDGLACTADSCLPDQAACSNVLKSGNCKINGACYQDGQVNKMKPCQICDVATSTTTWTVAAGQCFIDNTCWANGQVDPLQPSCRKCDADRDALEWTPFPAGTSCGTARTCYQGLCQCALGLSGSPNRRLALSETVWETRGLDATVGDLNADGLQDVAVVGGWGDNVQVFLRKPDGTFTSPVAYPTGVNPAAIAIADFNKDGFPDLTIANNKGSNFGSVDVLLNQKDGTFSRAVNYPSPSAKANAIATGDLNGSGFQEQSALFAGEFLTGLRGWSAREFTPGFGASCHVSV